MHGRALRLPAVVALVLVSLTLAVPAKAAGPKRIFVTKSDEKFKAQAGVNFELYQDTNGNGKIDAGEPKLQTKTTDANGKATFDPVNPGTYVVHEVPPAGYKDQPDQAVTIPNAKGPGPEIFFQNEPKPANHQVNNPTGDTAIEDGTHVFDFGPAIAPGAGDDVLIAWNDSTGFHPPGSVSGVSTAFSTDGGATWGNQVVGIPTGSNQTAYLGQPSVAFDPISGRTFLAADAFVNTASGLTQPILVSSSPSPGVWNDPVNTFPGIAPSPAVAHGASLTVDPATGDVYLGFTDSLGDGTSQVKFTRSTDGGKTWKPVTSISEVGAFDHVEVSPAPKRRVFITFSQLGGLPGTEFDTLLSRSTDGGKTFGEPVPFLQALPKAGTPGTCSGSATSRTVLGEAVVFDAGSLAVDPRNVNRLVFAYPVHGPGNDEGDVFLTRSNDGGQTWSPPINAGAATGVQWAPNISITPDGRVGMTYYDSQDGSTFDPMARFFDPFSKSFVGGPESLTDGDPFPLWALDPSFDTDYGNCFGLGSPAVAAPGSGFVFAWTDGRDPGPAGNAGVDPNIYAAHDIGPFLPTTTKVRVSTTTDGGKIFGSVAPPPVAGARVFITLSLKTGHGFDEVAHGTFKTDAKGRFAARFTHGPATACKVTAEFRGSEGRSRSSDSVTFAC